MLNALLLLGLHSFSFTPTMPSAHLERVTAAWRTHHAQNPHTWRNLKVHYISRSEGFRLSWDGQSNRLEQKIKFPLLVDEDKEPYGWWLTEYDAQRFRPHAFLWFRGVHTSLVFIATYLTGAYGVQSPIIYTLHGNVWKRLPFDPMDMSFTNRGGFYIQGDRVYVCDYGGESGYAHLAPQHYFLETFVIKNDYVRKLRTRWTYHRYPNISDTPPIEYPANIDPLRELGLRWRYWGEGRARIKISGDPN